MLFRGHNKANDDLSAAPDPQETEKAMGYLGDTHGDGYSFLGSNVTGSGSASWDPRGGHDVVRGWKQAGTSAFDKDVSRAREMGAGSHGREAVQIDRTASDQSRGMQMGALFQLGQAARGRAPSRAEALGLASNDATMRASMAGTAGRRGVAGMSAAMAGGAARAGQQNAQLADMRAQEISQAQRAFAGGTGQVRGQDLALSTSQAQLEAQQRALNEARQQGFERIAWDTRKQQQQAALDYERIQRADELARAQDAAAYAADEDATRNQAISMGTGLGIGVVNSASDERTKRNIRPMGSLSSLPHGG